MYQHNIFELMYQNYTINNKIRLIELFAGYGSQALALKYLNINFEHWRICEWAIKSIQAYKDIHFSDDNFDYSGDLSKDNLVNILYKLGISSNYNESMTKQKISKLKEDELRNIYNNIISTKNLVNIQQVKAEDLKIVDTDKYTYIMTYSFPCQDLSLVGKGKGMSDKSTRSGMLWEVERILSECKMLNAMPKILLMENVPQVHGADNVKDFNKWQLCLEELGYKNYFQDLIATDYGIPQTRNRCFMVSILGDYNYNFPSSIPLKIQLKDLLEDDVEEKYYLSDKIIKFFCENTIKQQERGNGFKFEPIEKEKAIICKTITTRSGSRMDDNYIINKPLNETLNQYDGKVINNCSFIDSYNKVIKNDGLIGTITTRISASNLYYLYKDLRIRKLTPKECFRLMGVKDEDYEKVSKNQTDGSLYHLAGDSIVVNVLMAIFKQLLGGDSNGKKI